MPALTDLSAALSSIPASPWLAAALGLAILLAGRRAFWLVLGGAGFVAGAMLVLRFFHDERPMVVLGVGAVAGLAGMLLVLFVQRFAVALAGFLVGGWAGVWLLQHWALLQQWMGAPTWPLWLVFVVCGIVAAFLAGWLFEWALIGVSALAGALILVDLVHLGPAVKLVALPALVLLGVIVQVRAYTGLASQGRTGRGRTGRGRTDESRADKGKDGTR
jgi:hypothetical protein